ncbi:MAG TPA: hypothetical protein VFM18_23980, partial [Methanosarcina sp.]|nr:hypothetical protein [Methanosarcina sp.]
MIEGAPTQTRCNGTLTHDLVPRTLADLLLKINEPKKRCRFLEEKKGSYRNHVNGDGVCRKCKKHK